MKKIYLLAATLFSALSFGQVVLYEDFNYTTPGNIGGNSGVTAPLDPTPVNNWVTHSNTAGNTGTIDVLSGNLAYSGLQAPTGNKILLPGSNTTVPRDINRAFTSSATTLYYSALVNVVDNTQLSTTTPNYFMGFGATSGISVTSLAARLGAYSTNGGTTYRLSIQNNSGGTPTFTDYVGTGDLVFGTTYLVVVKLDRAAAPIAATLWVNPSSLGGAEPSGSVSNNSGTTTFAGFGSIFLRNAAGGTPKVEIDEIRVGNTFADVTPLALATTDFGAISGLKMYPNPAKGILNITSSSLNTKNVDIYSLLGAKVLSSEVVNGTVNIASLAKGVYVVKITEEGKTATRELVVE